MSLRKEPELVLGSIAGGARQDLSFSNSGSHATEESANIHACVVWVSGNLTAGGIAGGSVMLVALIVGLVLSILWNKGMLPHTRYGLLVYSAVNS